MYHCIKRVKGRLYLYEQTSTRHGAQVSTQSRYICAVDPATGELMPTGKTPAGALQDIMHDTAARASVAASLQSAGAVSLSLHAKQGRKSPAQGKKPLSLHPQNPAKFETHGLRIRKDTAARLKISPHSLTEAHTAALRTLQGLGVPIDALPRVSLCNGWKLRRKFHKWAKCWTITAPRQTGGLRERARRLFMRTLAALQLDALEAHRPDLFKALSLQIEPNHAATARALRKYLLHTGGKGKLGKVLALKFWGNMPAIRTGKTSRLHPSKLALLEYGRQGDWRRQAVLLLAEIQQRGAVAVSARAVQERNRAQATMRRLERLQRENGRLSRADRLALGRAQARAELHNLQIQKINSLREILQLDGRHG